jgi:outer membrane protein assembly factor BamB
MLTTQTFDTPIDGQVRLRDVLVVSDEGVMALVERSGRIAAFDMDSGRLLWHATSPVSQVSDADARAGAIAIGGGAPPDADRTPIAGLSPMVALYDARTGAAIKSLDNLPGRVRWLRLVGPNAGAAVITGLDSEVNSFDLTRGNQLWSISGGPAFESIDAWVFADRLFLLDRQRNLWLAGLNTGQISRQPLETYEHLQGSSRIDCSQVGKDLAAFSTDRGVCIFDATGQLVGIDAVQGEADEGTLTMPAQSESYFVAVQTTVHQSESGQNVYDLHVMDAKTGILKSTRQLALELPPRFITILDGRILVTAGGNTIVYSAPEADR